MIERKQIAVVMPAYNAEKTLERTVSDLPGTVDIKILVDDSSTDQTLQLAHRLGLKAFVHDRNRERGKRIVAVFSLMDSAPSRESPRPVSSFGW